MIYNCFLETESLSCHLASCSPQIDIDIGNNYCVSFTRDDNGIICIKNEEPTVLVSQMPEYENIIKTRRLTNPKPSSPTKSSRFKRAGGKDIIITERQKQDIKNNKNY